MCLDPQFLGISKTQYFEFDIARNRLMIARLDSILKIREELGSGRCHNYKIGSRIIKFFYLFLINLRFLNFFQRSRFFFKNPDLTWQPWYEAYLKI